MCRRKPHRRQRMRPLTRTLRCARVKLSHAGNCRGLLVSKMTTRGWGGGESVFVRIQIQPAFDLMGQMKHRSLQYDVVCTQEDPSIFVPLISEERIEENIHRCQEKLAEKDVRKCAGKEIEKRKCKVKSCEILACPCRGENRG